MFLHRRRPTRRLPASSPSRAGSTSSRTTPATWCLDLPKRSRPSNSPSSMTSTCSRRSASIARRCRNCEGRPGDCSSEYRAAAPPAERQLSCALLRREGRHGCDGGDLCAGARALGIETSILVLGAFTGGTNHFATRAGRRTRRVSPSMKRVPMPASATRSCKRFPPSCLGMPTLHWSPTRSSMSWIRRSAKRPFRVHIDPTQDGAEVAFGVIDRVRNEMLHRVGFSNLLHPRDNA